MEGRICVHFHIFDNCETPPCRLCKEIHKLVPLSNISAVGKISIEAFVLDVVKKFSSESVLRAYGVLLIDRRLVPAERVCGNTLPARQPDLSDISLPGKQVIILLFL